MIRRTALNIYGLTALLGLLFSSFTHGAIIAETPFDGDGAGGLVNGQVLTIGMDGSVFELDAFVNIEGLDLNGAGVTGTSAQLGLGDPLPVGLDLAFNAEISADATDLILSYTFTNNTGADISGLTFLVYLDAEIGASQNDFASTSGSLAATQNFQVDDPFGIPPDLFNNLLADALDGVNHIGPGTTGDVAMALSWDIDTLLENAVASFDILISEDDDTLGSFSITQFDEDLAPDSAVITYSGDFDVSTMEIPVPGTFLLLPLGFLILIRRRKLV